MGIDVHGWVLVRYTGGRWESIIKIDPLFVRASPAFDWLIKAAHEGLPFMDVDVAPPPLSENEPVAAKEQEIGYNLTALDDQAWISWTEIRALDWSAATEEMHFLLALMQVLAQGYGPENLRLIFWFDG